MGVVDTVTSICDRERLKSLTRDIHYIFEENLKYQSA